MSLTARLGFVGTITMVALIAAIALLFVATGSTAPTELLAGPGGCCPPT